ncbi:SDR family NAD(P)-dependent oxidoreductase [Mucilaginibacter sp. HC2]|uniref:SDR family NAD(P)-dependent oxidoreductase n=1 Tax=Mucilaginibacter inviolabilis TaxID=2714892 RepID=UPI00140C0062|nr:SDR family NAD(P)-dependent oxidoreductase [Mucilaginibacter inviolabilis]NHA02805.1 SDR family NAD(P)-dependent oxidoreductase [Mucilaginibacter inviolabilis]
MQYINKNKKFVKASAISMLKLEALASTNALPRHSGLLFELIQEGLTESIPHLQPGEKFHIMGINAGNEELYQEFAIFEDQLTLILDAKLIVPTGSCDMVISVDVLSQPHQLSHLKTYLKQDGILVLQESAINEDTIYLLGEDGYEQMAVYLLENGTWIILAKSNGIIQIQEIESIPASQFGNTSDAECLTSRLINIAAAIIELPEDEFDTSMQFKDFGFDSILGVELINNINEALSITLKATDLYNYPNLTQLANYIHDQYQGVLVKPVVPIGVGVNNNTEKVAPTFSNPALNSIAIIGISGQFGSANDLAAYWDALKEGRNLVEIIPSNKWNNDSQHNLPEVKWASCLKDVDCFDPLFFKLSGTEAEMMDPKQRLFLEHCWKAFEDAAVNPDTLSSTKCGVYVGVGQSDYAARTEGTLPSALWGNSSAILASRISYFLNLKGPAIAVDTACSSSLVAMDMAFTSLQRGDTDLAIAGGVNIINTANAYTMANRAGMLSADGRCYTFDDRANGFVMGEGVGVIVMKRLADAERDNDRIYGVIRGCLTNQDGATNGITAPSVISQQELEKEVYERFNINPETITYVEAHGTGTSLGDPIEFEALTTSFRAFTTKQQFCSLGSVKTNIGHTLEAAGVAGLLKVLLAMQHQQLPPTINYKQHNPLIKLEGSPFKIQTKLADWVTPENSPRRAALSSFGFSGTNAHMVIEEYIPTKTPLYQSFGSVIFLLSAKNRDQLQTQARQFCQYLQTKAISNIHDIAYTLQIGRVAMEERLAIVADSVSELLQRLTAFSENRTDKVFTGNIRKKQGLLKGEADQTFIQQAIADKALDTLAQLWVNGKNIDWKMLYSEQLPNKISLPTYPFARERYWITSDNNNHTTTVNNFIYPLLHCNCSTLSEQKFSSIYTGGEFFLRDHQVLGDQVLPGVTYLEMARAAGEYAGGGRITQLRDINWLQPIKVNESAVEVHISLFATDEAIGYEIYTEAGDRQLHGQGILLSGAQPEPARHDIGALRSSLSHTEQGDSYYEKFRSVGLHYGESFQGIREISYSEESALSRIALPHQAGFVLSPGLLDSALQTCMGISLASGEQQLMLPFSVREVTIYQELPEEVWCYARQDRSGKHSGSYDLELLNASGEVLVQFTELVLLSLENNTEKTSPETTSIGMQLYTSGWQMAKSETTNQTESLPTLVLLAGGPALLADKLQEALACEVKTITASQPETFFIAIQEELQKSWQQKPGMEVQVVCTHADYLDYGFISGLLQTASQENPKIRGKVVVVDSLRMNDVEALTLILSSEQNSKDQEVRYLSGVREVKGIAPLNPIEKPNGLSIKADGVYLITGGNGGLGEHFAQHISKVSGARVVLAGRSELNQSKQALINSQKNTAYCRCDVSKAEEVTTLISTIMETYGRLDGIIHSAGVIRDSYILNKTAKEIQEVFGAKVKGARNLDNATSSIALDFMVYCSSLAGVFGNAAQADYASANAWLDNYAHYRETERKAGKRHGQTLSINWPLWASGGMQIGAENERYMAYHYGLLPMPTSEGLDAFEKLLNNATVQGIVLYGYHDQLSALTGQPTQATRSNITAPVADEALYIATLKYLGDLLASALKIPVAKMQPDVSFEQFGIDSTMIVGLTNRLEEVFGKVSRTLFFECQTLDELSVYFLTTQSNRLLELTSISPVSITTINIHTDKIKEVKKSRFLHSRSSLETHHYAVNKSSEVIKDIAIIGISGRYPGAKNLTEFWENLKAGKDSITEIPSTRWEMTGFYDEEKGKPGKSYSKWGGFMDDIDKFDPLFFNISPREAALMDPQERLFLQTAWETMEDGGYTRTRLQEMDHDENGLAAQVGVYVGVMYEEYQLFGPEETVKGNLVSLLGNPSGIANRVSYFLNLHGPSTAVDTMCSSSLTAIHLACKDLQSGEIQMAIAGGVNASIHPNKYLILSQGGFASSTGRCESFGEGGDGYVPGEGVGAVLLKPLQQAIADGDRIYGVIKGTAVNHGGKTNGYTVPNPKAQTAVIKAAMKKAGVQAEDISYIEAHGTGTSLGDPIEVAGLSKAFGTTSKQFCSLGSVKSNIGHCESAAGISGLTKVLLQLQHRQLVPSLHSAVLNPNIDFENSPFKVQQELAAWKSPTGKARIAGISGFGAGGSNAHIIIEEYTGKSATVYQNTDPVIIVLSARDSTRLQEHVFNLKKHIETYPEINIHEVAYTLQTGREAMEERLAFIAADKEELLQHLSNYLENKIQELLTGNIRKDAPCFLLEGKAGKAYLESAIGEKEGRSLAQLWTNGIHIDWNLLYTDERPSLVSLPTYPFAKDYCWFEKSTAVSPVTASRLHPLLHSNTSNLKEQPLHPLLHTYNSEKQLN